MKIDDITPTVVRAGDFKRSQFRIANVALILTILREKIYTDPVRVVVQEYASNARDAHREAGNSDRPIEISLPNALDSNLRIRDFGVSVDPERMQEVFIAYGESTKRESDDQTGGWGIGAKTGWAYGDSFGVISITRTANYEDANGNHHENCNVRRQYLCIIDESQIGEAMLVEEGVTEEEVGLEIVVACDDGDEYQFVNGLQRACKYWDLAENSVRPIVKGNKEFEWDQITRVFEGEDGDWFMEQDGGNSPLAILDGIPYPIDRHALKGWDRYSDKEQAAIRALFNHPVRLIFETHEIRPVVSREGLDYGRKETSEKILAVLAKVSREMQARAEAKIASAKNLWQATLLYDQIRDSFNCLVNDLNWNGVPIQTDGYTFGQWGVEQIKFMMNSMGEIRSKVSRSVVPSNKRVLIIDDNVDGVLRPNRARLKTVFAQLEAKGIEEVYTLRLPTRASKEIDRMDVSTEAGRTARAKGIEMLETNLRAIEEKGHLNKLGPVLLSSFEKTKTPRVKGVITKAYSFNGYWSSTDIDATTADGYYVPIQNRHPVVKGKQISDNCFEDLLDIVVSADNKAPIYGIPKRFIKKVEKAGGLVSIEDLVEAKIAELQNDEVASWVAFREIDSYLFSSQYSRISNCMSNAEFLDMLEDQTGVVCVFIRMSMNVAKKLEASTKSGKILSLFHIEVNEDKHKDTIASIRDLSSRFAKQYPLLSSMINTYGHISLRKKDVAFYCNAIDRNLAEESKMPVLSVQPVQMNLQGAAS